MPPLRVLRDDLLFPARLNLVRRAARMRTCQDGGCDPEVRTIWALVGCWTDTRHQVKPTINLSVLEPSENGNRWLEPRGAV